MDNKVFVEKIEINQEGILFVKPQNYAFGMIYRSAMGVYWDDDAACLYCKHPIKSDDDILKCYNQIVLAAHEEYGKTLCVLSNAVYENISDSMKTEIGKL